MDDAATALRRVGVMFADLDSQLGTVDRRAVFEVLTRVATSRVGGVESASVTTYDGKTFRTVADELARGADLLQYELGSGPCVDAIVEGEHRHLGDAGHDQRWPDFGRRAAADFGFASMLSVRLPKGAEAPLVGAGMNLYSRRADAFAAEAVQMALLLATHAGVVLSAASSALRVANLERSLLTKEKIGTAIGVLMTRYELIQDQAMDLLCAASQRSNRRVSDLAGEVLETGALPGPVPRRRPTRPDLPRRGAR